MIGIERFILRDDPWERVKHLLPGKETDRGVTAKDNRLFLEAVLWIARTGAAGRDLPRYFGNWNSVYVLFSLGEKGGLAAPF
jgi:transposase